MRLGLARDLECVPLFFLEVKREVCVRVRGSLRGGREREERWSGPAHGALECGVGDAVLLHEARGAGAALYVRVHGSAEARDEAEHIRGGVCGDRWRQRGKLCAACR